MPKYNIDAIKGKLDAFTKRGNFSTEKKEQKGKITFFRPDVGDYDIRFLNVAKSNDEQPIYEVLYYGKLSEMRFVAPRTFGLPDPIDTIRQELCKEKDIAKRKILRFVIPTERYYAAVINRAEEEKGPQIWEISQELCKDIYAILTHKDYVDEDLFDIEKGYDFSLSVTPKLESNGKPRTFNGSVVKSFSLQPRRKSSKLSSKPEQAKKWMDEIPDLKGFFTAQLKTPEEMVETYNAFLIVYNDYLASGQTAPFTFQGNQQQQKKAPVGTPKGKTAETKKNEVENEIDSAFADLEG